MINPFQIEDPALDAAIASAYSDLKSHSADSKEYAATVAQLTELYAIKNATAKHFTEAEQFDYEFNLKSDINNFEQTQAELPFYKRVDPNTLLTVAGNLLIGIAVIKYEQTNVISSKVMSFMKKI